MTRGRLCLVLLAKVIRSLFNGLFCCSFVPYNYYANFKGPSYMMALTICACALTALFKSNLINKHKNNPLKALYIAYLFFLPTLFINHYNLSGSWPIVAVKTIFILGLYPTDGEDFAFFEEAERGLISSQLLQKGRQKVITAYNIIGSLFQALGSLAALLYLDYDLASIQYVHRIRQNEMFILLYLLAIINMTLYTVVQVIHIKKQQAGEQVEQQLQPSSPPLDKKMKTANFINGLAVGALCAPILAYTLQLKFNLHTDTIGFVMFALFLLKGVGEELMRRLPALGRIFECWNILSAISLAWVYFSTDSNTSIYCILFALPMWYFGRVALRLRLEESGKRETEGESCLAEVDNLMAKGRDWERSGTVAGIMLSGFTFMVLYYKSYFGYAFLLGAFFKIVSHIFIQYFLPKPIKTKFEQVLDLTDPVKEVLDNVSKDNSDLETINTQRQFYPISKDTLDEGTAIPPQPKQPYCVLFNIRKIWPLLVLACLIPVYSYYSYSTYLPNLNAHFKTRSEKNDAPPQLKLFNSSLAHLWVKEGVKGVTLVDCDCYCSDEIRKRDDFYANMDYSSLNPQWVHFPNTPYFSRASQLQETVKILDKNPTLKGFSFAWDDPVRYNKMPYEIYSLLKKAGENYGFYYAQMPSLNLRPLQYRVIMVFTRQQRKPVTLPPFVGRQPPKNYLAFQSTLKLATNHQYLREFILYHLRLGFDKFFLYNNDRDLTDPSFYWQHRGTGAYFSECFNFGMEQVYLNMHDIWQDFYDHIIYVPMLIERRKNQVQGYINYGLFFRHEVAYTSFTDLDELIYSPSGLYLPDILQEMSQEDNVSGLLIQARNFISRICRKEQLAIEEPRWMVIPPGAVTIKNIVMTRLVYDALIHYKPTINGKFMDQTLFPNPRVDFTIFHYKVTETYEEFNGKNTFKIDDSMQPLVPGLKEACGGKCSDSRKITCPPQVYQQQMARYCIKDQ